MTTLRYHGILDSKSEPPEVTGVIREVNGRVFERAQRDGWVRSPESFKLVFAGDVPTEQITVDRAVAVLAANGIEPDTLDRAAMKVFGLPTQ